MELNLYKEASACGSISGSYSTSLRIGSTRRSMSLLVALFLGLTDPKNWTHYVPGVSHLAAIQTVRSNAKSTLGYSGIASSRWAWHDAHHRLHGYHGKHGCRLYCGLPRQRTSQGKHYFPTLLSWQTTSAKHHLTWNTLKGFIAFKRPSRQLRQYRWDFGKKCWSRLTLNALKPSFLKKGLSRMSREMTLCGYYLPSSFERPPHNITEKITVDTRPRSSSCTCMAWGPGLCMESCLSSIIQTTVNWSLICG